MHQTIPAVVSVEDDILININFIQIVGTYTVSDIQPRALRAIASFIGGKVHVHACISMCRCGPSVLQSTLHLTMSQTRKLQILLIGTHALLLPVICNDLFK